MLRIDEAADFEASIYVHACFWNVFKGASWGAVISTKNEWIELRSGSVALSMPRLLIEGCIEALQRIDVATPVRILCGDKYLTEYLIGSLDAVHASGYRRKGKAIPHREAIMTMRRLTWRRPYAKAETVSRADWEAGHFRAEELAHKWEMPREDDPPKAPVITSRRPREPATQRLIRPNVELVSPPWE